VRVERFAPTEKEEWDDFVGRSRNGTFLFYRDYMEYHSDRFDDHSLLFRECGGRLVALLPAHRRGTVLESHGGLTYGGFVVDGRIRLVPMLEVLDAGLEYLRSHAFSRLVYRAIPHIYHRSPTEEDIYCLIRRGARLVDRAALSVVVSQARLPLQERRKRALRKARGNGLVVTESDHLEEYWTLLSQVLGTTYESRPVHTLAEIELLNERFPRNIRLFCCYRKERMVAGVLVYESETVARTQYLAASELGKRLNALDLVLELLMEEVYRHKPFLDFGSSAGASESGLNEGVIEYKESWGARVITQDTYDLDITSTGEQRGSAE
jgi:hypothetical protein